MISDKTNSGFEHEASLDSIHAGIVTDWGRRKRVEENSRGEERWHWREGILSGAKERIGAESELE